MTSISDTHLPGPRHAFGRKSHPRKWTSLPREDHRQLQQYLDICQCTRTDSATLLAHVLNRKIMTTEPVSAALPNDVVTGGCQVSYSVQGGPRETGVLVHSANPQPGSGVIPVSSLLGATLIGMQVGQRAPLLREDGTITRISVLGVVRSA